MSTFALTAGLLVSTPLVDDKDAKPEEGVYASAKVGDWVSYKTKIAENNEITSKQSITKRDGRVLTLQVEQTVPGLPASKTETKIILDKSGNQIVEKSDKFEVKSEVEKLGSGKETLTIDGKAYECAWDKSKHTTTVAATENTPEFKSTSVIKVWRSKEVPLGGVVKTESETNGMTIVMILTGCGKGE